MTGSHYDWCPQYPATCPNKCDPKKTMPCEDAEAQIKHDCPLVECELSLAGCTTRPHHKDIEKHYYKQPNTVHYITG